MLSMLLDGYYIYLSPSTLYPDKWRHRTLVRGLVTRVSNVVKLREREGQGVDPGRSLKGHLWMVDGGWWYTFP